ncbi:MAG: GMC family oxidoreductase N-terminal domain-containing protein, partial [Thermoleophilaceae bacterium]|nr:GMC family oxidoreductase N-terminal domain-containing protein [Thermoleophilaceae bacterium]
MYDYVIVGAGSAGCVLANRLTEDPDVRVALVEAGPPDTADEIHMPAAVAALAGSRQDWDYDTLPELACDRRRIYLPRGKTLGGSSSVNAMVYIRGNRADYDAWRDAGNPGWGYDDLLPYFKRAEDNERGADEFHGVGGPLAVSDSRANTPIGDAFVESALAAGHQANPDFNGPAQEGVGRYQLTQRDGRRASAAACYLHPVADRDNLTIETYMHVRRVLFEGTRAVGVEAERMGEVTELRAEREVLVCGGAYNSPQTLVASGIGRAEELATLQIPQVVELTGVGMNLQDHANVWLRWETEEPVSLWGALTEENMALFGAGSGPLTSNGAETGGFARSSDALQAPDLQFHFFVGPFEEDGPSQGHGLAAAVCLLTPRSTGYVLHARMDPLNKPFIRHAYYAEPADMDAMVEGLRMLWDICGRDPLARHCNVPIGVPDGDDEDSLRAYVRRATQTLYHPTGTCMMGSGPEAVVDAELRVHGTEGLRVVDCSVMPSVPRGNTNAPVIAVAERAADLIR